MMVHATSPADSEERPPKQERFVSRLCSPGLRWFTSPALSTACLQVTASALKEALFRLNSKFELGEMHDATEAHEALLDALHRAVATFVGCGADRTVLSPSTSVLHAAPEADPPPLEAVATTPTVILGDAGSGDSFVKQIFSMRMRMVYAQPADPKEERSRPVDFEQWTQYVLASELRNAVRDAAANHAPGSPLLRVLRKEAGMCADERDAGAPTRKITMLRAPHIFTLGLASDSAHPSKSEIRESLQGIEVQLNLHDVYDGLADDVHCDLIALTAFYEQHYVCFCYSQAVGQWIHYDDDTRRFVGREFAAVREKCVAGRLHPMALFFEARSSAEP